MRYVRGAAGHTYMDAFDHPPPTHLPQIHWPRSEPRTQTHAPIGSLAWPQTLFCRTHFEKLKTMVQRPTAANEAVPSLLPTMAVDTMPMMGSSSTLT